jgi:hypothetical protein
MLVSWIRAEDRAGDPIDVGDVQLVPIVRRLRVAPRGLPWGLVWSRPKAVWIRRPGEADSLVPVRDVTRRAQVLILLGALLGGLLAWRMSR